MAKKKKTTKPMDIIERFKRHMALTDQVKAMIVRCEGLRDAGKTEAARRLLVRIERLTKELQQLENGG